MDKKVLDALTSAAMFPAGEGESIAQDLPKIHAMLDKAANSSLAQGMMKGNPTVARFQNTAVMTPVKKEEIPLREDVAASENGDENPAAQSKRYEAPYTTVPRIL